MIRRKTSFLPYDRQALRGGILIVIYEVPINYFENLTLDNFEDIFAINLIHNDFLLLIQNNYALNVHIGISATYVLIDTLTENTRTFYGAFSFNEANIRMLCDFTLYNFTKHEIGIAVYESLSVDNLHDKLMSNFYDSRWVFSHIIDVNVAFQCQINSKGKKNLAFLEKYRNSQLITVLN